MITDAPREYTTVITSLSRTRVLAAVPAAVSSSEWLRRNDHVVLALSPSIGAFADWLVDENGERADYTRETWIAVREHVAWYAAYMDTLHIRASQ